MLLHETQQSCKQNRQSLNGRPETFAELQVQCQPVDPIKAVITEYSMNSSRISLHFNNVAGTGSLQAVQLGHADQVSYRGGMLHVMVPVYHVQNGAQTCVLPHSNIENGSACLTS